MRQSDCLARLGGDEFAVLLPEAGTQEARIVANRILRGMTEPFDLSGVMVSVVISIWIAVCPPEKKISADALLVQADNAMYHAKSTGSG
ncbi:MAG: GGDEF domain-containing protein [Desulfobacterales bacterium]|nr:GGDEF domain-containing protein [Desulfobacterales bacterium]